MKKSQLRQTIRQIIKEEFERNPSSSPNQSMVFTPPEGFKTEPITSDLHDVYEGEVVGYWSCPMEGWDNEHEDHVLIVKKEDGFYVDGYISFGEFETEGPFQNIEAAKQKALEIMEELKSEWRDY